MKWIETRGASLRFELRGAGPATILIHEAGGSLESWDAVAPAFAADGHTLRYDQRGFGLSERVAHLSLETMVADLIGLLDALAIDGRCRLVGTAIGGSIALAAAALHPDRVATVIATSPVSGGLNPAVANALEQRAQLVEREGMRAIADASLQRSYPERFRGDADAFSQYRLRFLANDPRSFAALSRTYPAVDLAALYPRIECPVLVIGCSADPIKPAAECRDLAARLPCASYREVDSGHYIGVISPQLLIDAAREFHAAHRTDSAPQP